jgi:polyisoprenoid-binding protein YceI
MKWFQKIHAICLTILIALSFLISMKRAWPAPIKSGATAAENHYHLDPPNSRFYVFTESAGVFKAFGHNHKIVIPDFSGEVTFDPADLNGASLQVKIPSQSLFVEAVGKKEEKDKPKIEEVMRKDVLEVVKFPEILFSSTGMTSHPAGENEYEVTIRGDLSLHGVTKNIPIETHVILGKDHLTARGEFKIKQTDYQIHPVSVAGGTVKVKDEIRLSFELAAHP